MSTALGAVAFLAGVVCGTAMALGLAAIVMAHECSEDEQS